MIHDTRGLRFRASILMTLAIISLSAPARGQVLPPVVTTLGPPTVLGGGFPSPYAGIVQEHARAVLMRSDIACLEAVRYASWTILGVATSGFLSGPNDPRLDVIGAPTTVPVPAYVGSYTLRGEDGVARTAHGSVFGSLEAKALMPPRGLPWEDGVLGQHIVTVNEELPADSEGATRLMDRALGGAGARYLSNLTQTRYGQNGEPCSYWFVGRGLGAISFGAPSGFTVALGVIAAGPRCFVVHTTGFGKYSSWLETRDRSNH